MKDSIAPAFNPSLDLLIELSGHITGSHISAKYKGIAFDYDIAAANGVKAMHLTEEEIARLLDAICAIQRPLFREMSTRKKQREASVASKGGLTLIKGGRKAG